MSKPVKSILFINFSFTKEYMLIRKCNTGACAYIETSDPSVLCNYRLRLESTSYKIPGTHPMTVVYFRKTVIGIVIVNGPG